MRPGADGFLLHGILSTNALHLALIGVTPPKNTLLATHHHRMGVDLFRAHLVHLTVKNKDPAFAITCVILYAIGIQKLTE